MKRILLCTDGEEQTARAERTALDLALQNGALLVGLYVVDPFLKKFTHEIYAINRDACRDHLDRLLREQGEKALEALANKAEAEGIRFESRMRYGSPEEEILKEIDEQSYDLLVMGSKLLKGWRQRMESVNLPRRVFMNAPISLLFVR